MKMSWMVIAVATMIGGIACGSRETEKQPTVRTAAMDKKFEECREKLKEAQQLGMLYNLDMRAGRPLVVVGPTFYNVAFDAKQGFANTINGFLMTGEDKFIDFELLDYRTNKVVAKYSYGRLEMK